MIAKMAITLRHLTLTKNLVHKKCFELGSAWYSSAPPKKSLWEVRYKNDGREDTVLHNDDSKNATANDFFVKLTLFLQRDVDFSFNGFKNWMKNFKGDAEVFKQRFIPRRVDVLGPELAVAHFVVFRGGAVKFYNNKKWIRSQQGKSYDLELPKNFLPGVVVEAVDASNTNLIFEALVHFELLKNLKWLSFRNNVNVNDWFLDRLAFFKNTLEYLDISDCPNVTERGVMSLHRFRYLKVLKLGNLQGVKHIQLLRILLEEVLTDCKIEGIESEIDKLLLNEQSSSEKLLCDQPLTAVKESQM